MQSDNNEKIEITVENTLSENVNKANDEEKQSEQQKKTLIFSLLSFCCLILLSISLLFAYKNSELRRARNLKSFKENGSDWTELSEKELNTENNSDNYISVENVKSYEEYKASLIEEATERLQEHSEQKTNAVKSETESYEKNTRRSGNRLNINFNPKISFGSYKGEQQTKKSSLTEKLEKTETERNAENQTGFLSDDISDKLIADRKTMLIHSENCPKSQNISEEKRLELSRDEIDNYSSHGYNICPYCKCRKYVGVE